MNIKHFLLSALIGAVVASLVLIGGRLVGDQSADLGGLGRNRYPNSGLIARYLTLNNTPGTTAAGVDQSLYVAGTSTFVGAVTGSGALTGFTSGAFSTTLTVGGEAQLDTLVHGGGELSMATSSTRFTSSTGTYLVTAADCCNNSVISIENWAGAGSSTVVFTLPTATALFADCLDTHGDTKEFLFRNEASALASSTAITAGTNIVLTTSTASGVTVGGGKSARIQLWRLNATATSSGVQVNVAVMRDGD